MKIDIEAIDDGTGREIIGEYEVVINNMMFKLSPSKVQDFLDEFKNSVQNAQLAFYMKNIGWELANTGGGCVAWYKSDAIYDFYWFLTDEDGELPTSIDSMCVLVKYNNKGDSVAEVMGQLKEVARII